MSSQLVSRQHRTRQQAILATISATATLFLIGGAVCFVMRPDIAANHGEWIAALLVVAALSSVALFLLGLRCVSASRGLVAMAEELDRIHDLESVSASRFPGGGELDPLASSLFSLLSRLKTRQDDALALQVSNRLLAREFNRLILLLDSVADGIVAVDNAGMISLANGASAPFLKVSPEDAKGRPSAECIRHAQALELLGDSEAEGAVRGIRSVELPPDQEGRGGHVAVLHSRGSDSQGEPLGQLLMFRDISRIKNVERLQSEFVDSVAHELRTPLTSIRAYIEMLIDGEAEDPQAKYDFYNVIYEETDRLSLLIDNLLNMSMMDSGAAKLDVSATRIMRVLEDCAEVVRPQCEKKNVRFVVDLPDRLPALNIDKKLFGVAVMNVLGNAAKYTPEDGNVTISTESQEDEFRIVVSDTGVGIAEENLERVFDKFFRCSGDGEVSGSGIGLATARQIARLHGGDIRLTSKVGEGSRFVIALPRTLINSSIGE